MSVLRQDPTTRQWMIIAPGRDRRPHDVGAAGPPPAACPFCPGREDTTPAERFRIADPATGQWAVRVVPNRFAALTDGGEPVRRELGPFLREMDGVGHHEVIIETPHHDRPLALMAEAEVRRVLEAYRARYLALRAEPSVRHILIFKNHGEKAGTSLSHPHSQLVATPVAPLAIRRRYEIAIAHYDDTGRCLYCDLVEAELAAKVRVVAETPAFVVLHPFAPRAPFETWIMPRRQAAAFGQTTPEELAALAPVLRDTVRALRDVLGDPDFNLVIHGSPTEDEGKGYYLWHLQILPRLSAIAGFELGSGMFVTSLLPEESAARMRAALASGG